MPTTTSGWDRVSLCLSVAILAVVAIAVIWSTVLEWRAAARCHRLHATYYDERHRIDARIEEIITGELRGQQQRVKRYKKQVRALEQQLTSKGCPLPVGED
jgi:hypothetical protein